MRYNPATEDPDRPHSVEELALSSGDAAHGALPQRHAWAQFWITYDEDAFLVEALRRYRAGEGL